MKSRIQNAWTAIPRVTRGVLSFLLVLNLTALVLRAFHLVDLGDLLALNPALVLKGQIWRLITHSLIEAGLLNLVVSLFLLAGMLPRLEQAWRPVEVISFCVIVSLGVGLIKLTLMKWSPSPLLGMGTLVLGTAMAWAKLFGDEVVQLFGTIPCTVRTMVYVALGITVVLSLMLSPGSVLDTFLALSGAMVAWVYLSLRWERNRRVEMQTVATARFERLEL
ncbi:MAG TPA: rhomboid family intramembrane serine protease [Roseimicrobium sp.]|nr:rhomboid family intramembrane serine protease [Roseimicrobium sp.]